MGCDIHLWIERRTATGWVMACPFHTDSDAPDSWVRWEEPYARRNYFAFALIANVRNRRDHFIEPISEPRGLPADVSEVGARILKQWSSDAHSASWLSAHELLTHDWERKVRIQGYVSLEDDEAYRRTQEAPQTWTNHPRAALVHPLEWEATERTLCEDFSDFVTTLSQHGPPEDVRICFFFDN